MFCTEDPSDRGSESELLSSEDELGGRRRLNACALAGGSLGVASLLLIAWGSVAGFGNRPATQKSRPTGFADIQARPLYIEMPRELAKPNVTEAQSSTSDGGATTKQESIEEFGVVDAIYTFGAPGSAKQPLENMLRDDRCFAGLRSYTEDVLGPATKQVDGAAISNTDLHARMPTVVLHWNRDSIYVAGPGETTWPNDNDGGVFGDWRLHWETDYAPRLKQVAVNGENVSSKEPFATASKFVTLAYKIYDSLPHARADVATKLPGWKVVALETLISGTGTIYDEDPVMLVQDSSTLDCALVLAGTNNLANELTSSTTGYDSSYCGFSGVHVGYRNELWHIMHYTMPALRPKLAKCGKVSCVGHSMGGPLCEIFSACANSGRQDDADFQQQSWPKGMPAAMDEITKGEALYKPNAERRCEEPPCR